MSKHKELGGSSESLGELSSSSRSNTNSPTSDITDENNNESEQLECEQFVGSKLSVERDEELQTTIEAVRQEVLTALELGDKSVPDSRDIERVRRDDELIERFVLDQKMEHKKAGRFELVQATSLYLMQWLQWRCSYGLNDLRPETLPREAWTSGVGCVYFGHDKSEDHIVYVCIRKYKKVSKAWTDVAVRFIVCCTEMVLARTVPGQKLRVVLDTSGLGYSNADISLGMGIVPILFQYYPGLIRGFYVIDPNFIVKATFHILIKAFPAHHRDKITFIDRSSLIDEFGADAVPEYLSGSGANVHGTEIFVNDRCEDIESFGRKNDFSPDSVKKFKKMLLESKALK